MTLERIQIEERQLISDSDESYWEGLLNFATKTRSKVVMDSAEKLVEKAVGGVSTDNMVLDSILPSHRMRAYSNEVVETQNLQQYAVGIDYEAFGFDTSYDPRAKEIVVTEESFSGLASRYCCGIDGTKPQTKRREITYKRGWYSDGDDLCFTDGMDLAFAGIDNWLAKTTRRATMILNKVRIETGFYGDQIYNMTGLCDLPIARMRLDTPLDLMTPENAYDLLVAAKFEDKIKRGDEAQARTHMLAPEGFGALLARRMTGTSIGETIGDSIKLLNMKTKFSNYMNLVGVNQEPCILMYNRDSREIQRDIAYTPFMLPPEEHRGKLYIQMVARFGELRIQSNNSAIMLENVLSTGAY